MFRLVRIEVLGYKDYIYKKDKFKISESNLYDKLLKAVGVENVKINKPENKVRRKKQKENITRQVLDLEYELAIGSITKKEFDSKYKHIVEKNEYNSSDFNHIFISIK